MNKLKTLACVISAGIAASMASAAFIEGSIAFDGSLLLDSPITSASLVTPSGVEVADLGAFGDYSAVPSGTPVFLAPISSTPALPISPLWSFTYDGLDYSFTMTSFAGFVVTPLGVPGLYSLALSGTGIASITGFDDTVGAFSLTTTGNTSQLTLGLGAFTFVPPDYIPEVSDSGTTVALLGVAMLGFVIVRRRNRIFA